MELLSGVRYLIICVLMEHTASSATPYGVLSERAPRESIHSRTNFRMIKSRSGSISIKEEKMSLFPGNLSLLGIGNHISLISVGAKERKDIGALC